MARRDKPPPYVRRPAAYMTTAELAARWRVSEGHLRNRRVAGRAPRYFKDEGVIRYRLTEIEEHEQSHTIDSTSQEDR